MPAGLDGVLLSRKVANDEQEIVQVLADAVELARQVSWTVDLTTVEAALLLSVLWANAQQVRYLSGRSVNHAARIYRGEGMIDARDARAIADQSRMRGDLPVLRPGDDLIAELRMLTGRRAGLGRLTRLLTDAGVRNAARIAEAALAAAKAQTVRLPGEDVAAELVAALAREVVDLDARIKQADTAIEDRSGDLNLIESADHLDAYAGLAKVANDSGQRTGRLHTPNRYNRRLRRAMYMSALTSVRCHPESRAYYDRKRAEGKRAIRALICLARRRANVLWALLRDNRTWQTDPPTA